MGLFDFLRSRPKNTASIAKERLRIIVAQERTSRGTPDYLPMLRRELLEVIRKYVSVDFDAGQERTHARRCDGLIAVR
jgi:cell division topological specificity factor